MPTVTVPYDWAPREYQLPFWTSMESGDYRRACIVWHRRAGKDITSMNWTIRSMFKRVGLYWHILPTYEQGRKIVWNGMTGDGRRFLDHFPPGTITRRREDLMFCEIANGSFWQVVGTDDPNRLVGSNPVGCVFSEYSLQNPAAWDLIRPILAENGGWAVFIYTARGRNHGYDLLQQAQENPEWFAQVLTVDDTRKAKQHPETRELILDQKGDPILEPVVSPAAIEDDRQSGMPEELILQEYWCSFDAPLVGSYYGDQMQRAAEEGRIGSVPHDPSLPVQTWWDIGLNDDTAIWFVQLKGNDVRVIDYEQSNGRSLEGWIKAVREKPYNYSFHLGPHDLNVKEFTSGRSRFDTALNLGLRFSIQPKISVQDGIHAVRMLIPRCFFDEEKCRMGIEALRQYRKEWDQKKGVYRDKPMHDWASHGADAFRCGSIGYREMVNAPRQMVADQEYPELTPFDDFRQMQADDGLGEEQGAYW